MLDDDNRQFIPNARGQQTLLQGVDTEGLTTNQKKKLKKRLKKEKQKDDDGDEPLLEKNECVEESSENMSKRTKATFDQLLQMNENEEDLQWQRPRSHSLPNLSSKSPNDFEDYDEEIEKDQKFQFVLERNFGYEIQEYLSLRKELRRRKTQLMNGEIDPEDLQN